MNVPLDRIQNGLDDLISDLETAEFTSEFVEMKELLLQSSNGLKFAYENFIESTVPEKRQKTRQKRSWDAFGNALKWAGGVMNSDDRHEMYKYLTTIYDNQTKINKKMDSIMTQLNMPSELKAEKNDEKFDELQRDVKRSTESSAMQKVKKRFDLLATHVNAVLSTYINRKLDGALVSENLIRKFAQRMNDTSQYACESPVECLRNSEVKIERSSNKDITMTLKLPVADNNSLQLYQITAIPAAYNDHLLILKPPHKYYAFDESNEELIAFSENYKQTCIYGDSSSMFCKTENLIANVNTHDCLLTAIRDKIVDTEICSHEMELMELDDFAVVKFDEKRYWIYSEFETSVVVKCRHESEQVKNITGIEVIDLPFGCRGTVNNLKLISYAAIENEQSFIDKFTANISKESFREVINTMAATTPLKNQFIYDFDSMNAAGLKEKVEDESWHAKNQWQENELKVLHAEHNKFIIIALVLVVAVLLFIVFRRRKSIFIFASRKETEEDAEEAPPKYNDDPHGSDTSLNIKASYK